MCYNYVTNRVRIIHITNITNISTSGESEPHKLQNLLVDCIPSLQRVSYICKPPEACVRCRYGGTHSLASYNQWQYLMMLITSCTSISTWSLVQVKIFLWVYADIKWYLPRLNSCLARCQKSDIRDNISCIT